MRGDAELDPKVTLPVNPNTLKAIGLIRSYVPPDFRAAENPT